MKVIQEEAQESYQNVVILASNTEEDMERNVERIQTWINENS